MLQEYPPMTRIGYARVSTLDQDHATHTAARMCGRAALIESLDRRAVIRPMATRPNLVSRIPHLGKDRCARNISSIGGGSNE